MLTLIQKIAHLCLKPLIALFDFPIVPAELVTLVNKLFEYMQVGTGILNFFVPFDVIRPAIDVFLAVWAVEQLKPRGGSCYLDNIEISEAIRETLLFVCPFCKKY